MSLFLEYKRPTDNQSLSGREAFVHPSAPSIPFFSSWPQSRRPPQINQKRVLYSSSSTVHSSVLCLSADQQSEIRMRREFCVSHESCELFVVRCSSSFSRSDAQEKGHCGQSELTQSVRPQFCQTNQNTAYLRITIIMAGL